eukprot:PhM_4_TR3774/c0_g1_i2/m.59914
MVRKVGEVGIIRAKGVSYAYKQEKRTKVSRLARRLRAGMTLDEIYQETYAQFHGRRLNLSHNRLVSISEASVVLSKRFVDIPRRLVFLDLSHNQLASIPDSLGFCPCLASLHLHDNDLKELSNLQALLDIKKSLKDLAIHGNPFHVGERRVRRVLVMALPNLKTLNFSTILDTDRATAARTFRTAKKIKDIFID